MPDDPTRGNIALNATDPKVHCGIQFHQVIICALWVSRWRPPAQLIFQQVGRKKNSKCRRLMRRWHLSHYPNVCFWKPRRMP